MFKTLFIIAGSICVLLAPIHSFSQVDSLSQDSLELIRYYDQSLADLDSLLGTNPSEVDQAVNPIVNVASSQSLKALHSPNVVTVISAEEIEAAGARDLIDVLRMVPGFSFGLDMNGKVGLGVRGNWANEGKILLMIDGQEMNDVYLSKLTFGNHYPVEHIRKIEIIRGPGSAIYGGSAAYAVINIITISGEEYSGLKGGLIYGAMEGTRARWNRYFYIGGKWKDFVINFSNYNGNGQRSDRDHFAYFNNNFNQLTTKLGRTVSLADQSDLDPDYSNFFVKWKGLSYRAIVDLYKVTDVSDIDTSLQRPIKEGIRTSFNEFSYDYEINDKWSVKPTLGFTLQFPQYSGIPVPDSVLDTQEDNRIRRTRFKVQANYKASHRVNFTGGIDIFRDKAEASGQLNIFPVGEDEISYTTYAAYLQGIFKTPIAYFTTGLRFDWNTTFGSALAPRVAIAKRFNRFHFKVMTSGAFRAPSIGNVALFLDDRQQLDLNPDSSGVRIRNRREIEPEYTLALEAEVGFRINDKMQISGNVFNITTYNTIVLSSIQNRFIRDNFGELALLSVYTNQGRSGSVGFEFDFHARDKWGFINANYSYNAVENKTRPPAYQVTNFAFDPMERTEVDPTQLLGLPRHRFNFQGSLNLGRKLSLNLTAHFFGPRYTFDIVDEIVIPTQVAELVQSDPEWIFNSYIQLKDFPFSNFRVGLGVYNMFNTNYKFYQPYFGVETPLPGPSREVAIRFIYDLNFGN